jgi:cytochrome c peroxidase
MTTGLLRALGGNLIPSPEETQMAVIAMMQAVRPQPPSFGGFGNLGGIGVFGRRPVTTVAAKKKRAEKTPLRLAYNTPSLIGVGATGPYFHDGSAKTLREVVTVGNPGDRMGRTSQLSSDQVDALVAYLETL